MTSFSNIQSIFKSSWHYSQFFATKCSPSGTTPLTLMLRHRYKNAVQRDVHRRYDIQGEWGRGIWHRKRRETKQQPSRLPCWGSLGAAIFLSISGVKSCGPTRSRGCWHAKTQWLRGKIWKFLQPFASTLDTKSITWWGTQAMYTQVSLPNAPHTWNTTVVTICGNQISLHFVILGIFDSLPFDSNEKSGGSCWYF